MESIKKICVIGAGTMGNGIAHVFAQSGFEVNLFDQDNASLENGLKTIAGNLERQVKKGTIDEKTKTETLSRIKGIDNLNSACSTADLCVEAIVENEEVKKDVFKALDTFCPPHTILASNTSSISITRIASCTKRPDRVIGMHFMNPVPVMKLIEVIKGYSTTDEVAQTIKDLSAKLGKIAVVVEDYPGFVANRILMPMINEAIYTLFEGVAGVEEIDTVMKLGMAHPMGPLQLADFIGLDVCYYILNVMHRDLGNPKYFPCPLLANMVAAGNKGVKTGVGFYEYTPGSKDLKVARRFSK